MNKIEIIAIIIGAVPSVVSVSGIIFAFGRITGKLYAKIDNITEAIKEMTAKLDNNDARVDQNTIRLAEHEVRLTLVEKMNQISRSS